MRPALPRATARLDMLQEVDAQSIPTTLDHWQWSLQGRRNRAFVLVSGTGEISYKGESTALSAPLLLWMPTGAPAQLTMGAGARGAWLAISDAALAQVDLPGHIAEDMRRFSQRAMLGRKISRDHALRLIGLIAIMESELRETAQGMQEMIRHHLAILSILLWRDSDLAPIASSPAPRMLVSDFLRLIDQHMRRHWRVIDYARYLGISEDRLSAAVQRATGQTPLGVIHGKLHLEACQMLESSGLQVSEIATHLGFEDPAYFARFFRRHCGISPREWRQRAGKAQAQENFASWP